MRYLRRFGEFYRAIDPTESSAGWIQPLGVCLSADAKGVPGADSRSSDEVGFLNRRFAIIIHAPSIVVADSKSDAPVDSRRRIDYDCDYMGRRIKKKVSKWNAASGSWTTLPDRKFVYDGWNLIAELDSSNNLVQSYLWGLDLSGTMQGAGGVGGLLAVKPANGIARFVAKDGNGNVAGLVTGGTGPSLNGEYEYGPFGEPIRVTGTMGKANPFRCTKYTDDETDLVYYGYRYYNPSTGRWLSRDPIGEEGGINLYAFVNNKPVNSFDPLGLILVEVHEPITQGDSFPFAAWNSRFDVDVSQENCTAKVLLRVRTDIKVSDRIAKRWKSSAESVWGDARLYCDTCKCPKGIPISLALSVLGPHDDGTAHHGVVVQNQTRNMQIWGLNDSDRAVAHEVGHMLGNPDEYPSPPQYTTSSIMNNPRSGFAFARHFKLIADKVGEALGGKCTVKK